MARREEEEKLVILVANLGKGSTSNASDDDRLNAVSNFFAKTLRETHYDVVFAQEVSPNTQVNDVQNLVGFSCSVRENSNSYTATFWRENVKITDHSNVWPESVLLVPGRIQESDQRMKRFRMCKLTRGERSVLLVNFHGNTKIKENKNKKNKVNKKDKVTIFLEYLAKFQQIKVSENCDFLVVGGDFNFDLDTFARGYQNILDGYNLMVVPYQHQRMKADMTGLKEKIDGLICDKELWRESEQVVVYHYKKRGEENTARIDPKTSVIAIEDPNSEWFSFKEVWLLKFD